ncbi:hypothetical protein DAPPUDRAFT_323812 [Daphnia pulex]|uniref:Uncharacterized protein n=1 Tax=Daphnia pulex TaxID=6669 RepID=E9GZV0_DAPPU|nr:hypothetical protein DAPPUDRAFT_323812 [Daphnia pulex]|eukprot:EFX74876.1 hypothetical protein DAPPUDRAFT_323812 [Daphnia pulex]
MTDRTKRRQNQENAPYLQFRCERDNYSNEVSESDVERSSTSSQLDVIEVIGISPDTQAETRVQQLSTLEVLESEQRYSRIRPDKYQINFEKYTKCEAVSDNDLAPNFPALDWKLKTFNCNDANRLND